MSTRSMNRISRGRLLTPEEAAHYRALREKIATEAPAILERGRKIKADIDARRAPGNAELDKIGASVALQDAMVALARIRVSQGLSLADLNERTGIDRSVLSKLERREVANPTIDTLNRIAGGLGRKLVVSAVPDLENQPISRDRKTTVARNVAVVGAESAWDVYQELSVYICQAGRLLGHHQELERIAFYTKWEVKRFIPKILRYELNVDFEKRTCTTEVDDLITRIVSATRRPVSRFNDIYYLTPPNAPDTVDLGRSVRCDKKDKNGSPAPYTMKHRYVSLAALRAAKVTSDLED